MIAEYCLQLPDSNQKRAAKLINSSLFTQWKGGDYTNFKLIPPELEFKCNTGLDTISHHWNEKNQKLFFYRIVPSGNDQHRMTVRGPFS